jgi:hypothetical protein
MITLCPIFVMSANATVPAAAASAETSSGMKNIGVPFAVFGGNTATRSCASRRRNIRSTPRCWCGSVARNPFDTTTERSPSVGTGTTHPARDVDGTAPG